MAQPNVKHFSGNTARILFDGQEVGTLYSVNCTDSYNLEPVTGIGDIHVQEHVPTVATHSISASTAVLRNKSLRAAGVAAENGDEALLGMEITIEIFDNNSGALLRKYTGCSYDGGSITVGKNTVVIADASFKARDASGIGL